MVCLHSAIVDLKQMHKEKIDISEVNCLAVAMNPEHKRVPFGALDQILRNICDRRCRDDKPITPSHQPAFLLLPSTPFQVKFTRIELITPIKQRIFHKVRDVVRFSGNNPEK